MDSPLIVMVVSLATGVGLACVIFAVTKAGIRVRKASLAETEAINDNLSDLLTKGEYVECPGYFEQAEPVETVESADGRTYVNELELGIEVEAKPTEVIDLSALQQPLKSRGEVSR